MSYKKINIGQIKDLIESLFNKSDKATTYTKTEVDTNLNLKADKTTTYTKIEVSNSLALKADLVGGLVPANQLPSYIDDVLSFDNKASFPATGEDGKIYLDKEKSLSYRWAGSSYAQLDASIAIGETSTTAYQGDKGKIAYTHSQTTGNPHGLTKADLLLNNVPNIDCSTTSNITDVSNKRLMTDAERTKLSGLLSQVNSDWNSSTGLSQILNKPTIPSQYTDTMARTAVANVGYLTSTGDGSSLTGITPTQVGSYSKSEVDTSLASKANSTHTHTGLNVNLDTTNFNKNLSASITDTQKLADAIDDLSIPTAYTLPVASTTTLGGVKQGSNIVIDANGVISGTNSYTLPKASTTTLGGVKVDGTTIMSDANGLLSLGASGGYTTATIISNYSETVTSGTKILLCSSGVTVTLPSAISNTAMIIISKIDSTPSVINILTSLSQRIHGDAMQTLYTKGDSFVLISDNANWWYV